MERNYKITIPKPCSESWDKMTPNENGRFCMSCAKTVIDFTEMLPEEVQHFFIQNKNKDICGRFKKSQLDTITIQIPNEVLFTPMNYQKMFLLALFFTMGTTLFSCKDKNGKTQKIDRVEIVADSTNAINAGKTMHLEKIITPSAAKEKPVQFAKQKTKKSSNTKTLKFTNPKLITNNEILTNNTNCEIEDVVYGGAGIEVSPDYVGGIEKFYDFFKNEYKTPRKARKEVGEIQISFVIGKDGTIEDIKPNTDIGLGTSEEATRVLNLSPKWYPGEQNGKKTRTKYYLLLSVQKDSLNPKRRKQNRSTITDIKVTDIETISNEINLNLKP